MSIDEIVQAWKAEDEDDEKDEQEDSKTPENPAGQELSDEELEQAAGGIMQPGCGVASTRG